MDVNSADREIQQLVPLMADLFSIDAVYRQADRVAFSLTHRYSRARSVKLIRDRLRVGGFKYTLTESDDGPVILTVDPRRSLYIPKLNIILFLATIISIYLVPVFFTSGGDFALMKRNLLAGMGLQFTAALVSILLIHEMGHYVASRRRGIVTTWPYFIPAPNLFGTFGAVIASKSPFWNRRDLLEVGAAGPIAGWIVAIGWLIYGLAHTRIVPVTPPPAYGWSLQGESIIMTVLAKLMVGTAPDGFAYRLS